MISQNVVVRLVAVLALGVAVVWATGAAADGLRFDAEYADGLVIASQVLLVFAAMVAVFAPRSIDARAFPSPGIAGTRNATGFEDATVAGTVVGVGPGVEFSDRANGWVAAFRLDYRLSDQNACFPFIIDTGDERIGVRVQRPVLAVSSWRHDAVRPRWFGRGAWAPEAAQRERLDWISVRPGDFIVMRGELRRAEAGPMDDVFADAVTTSVELVTQTDDSWASLAVMHPVQSPALARRQTLEVLGMFAALACGIAASCWAVLTWMALGTSPVLPWLFGFVAAFAFAWPLGSWVATMRVRRAISSGPLRV